MELNRLMPLKITQGWAITYNQFFDEEPKLDEDGTSIINWECYKEDLFQACKLVLADGKYQQLNTSKLSNTIILTND